MFPFFKNTALYALCAFLLLACTANDTAEKPSELVEFEAEAKFNTLWQINTGAGSKKLELHLKPFFNLDTVYVGDVEGRVSAVNAANGKKIWEVKTGLPISGGIGGAPGYLFFGTRDGLLVALRQNNGEMAWTAELSSESLVVPAADSGIVVTRTVDGNIQAFSIASGEKIWAYRQSVPALSLRGNSDPVIFSGGVLVGSDNGRLTALALSNGRLLRETPVAIPSGSSELSRLVDVDAKILVDRGFMYVAAFQGRVVCLSLDSGQAVWTRDISTYQEMSLGEENLYLADENGHVWALNRSSGATVWVQDKLRARPITGPAVYQNAVLVGDYEGYVHAMHVSDGRFIARDRIGKKDIKVEPFINDNKIFIVTRKGKLTALTLENLQLASNK